jgi:hypothetical protein
MLLQQQLLPLTLQQPQLLLPALNNKVLDLNLGLKLPMLLQQQPPLTLQQQQLLLPALRVLALK